MSTINQPPTFANRLIGQLSPRARAIFEGLSSDASPAPTEAPDAMRSTSWKGCTARDDAPKPLPPRKGNRRRKGPKLDRRQRAKLRLERDHTTERRIVERVAQRIHAAGGRFGDLPAVPARVWRMAWAVVGDATGQAARHFLGKLQNRAAAGAIMRAALAHDLDDKPRYSWSQLRARRIAALGLALAHCARSTRRRGPWGAVVMGLPRGAFRALLRDPLDMRGEQATPSVSAVFGVHRPDGCAANGEVGYFRALREAGAMYSQQMRAEHAHACELYGQSGYATNRYWIVSDEVGHVDDDPRRREILECIALAGNARRAWAHRLAPPTSAASPPSG